MTSSCLSFLAGVAVFLSMPYLLNAQMPRSLSVSVVLGSPLPDNGLHTIHVRWYDDPSARVPRWQETVVAGIQDGRCDLILGNAASIPDTLLRTGSICLGYSIDDEPERQPRSIIVPVALAQTAAYAEVAARLDPHATGLVTSINEVAGAVSVVGSHGIGITRQGSTLTISAASAPLERGVIRGDGSSSSYRVQPGLRLMPDHRVTFDVRSPTTMILGQVHIDSTTNELVFHVSAPLLPDEQIAWSIHP